MFSGAVTVCSHLKNEKLFQPVCIEEMLFKILIQKIISKFSKMFFNADKIIN